MKLIYKGPKEYKVWDHKILGYPISIHGTEKCGFLISVPMGDNEYDRKMFDSLVYYNHPVYHAFTRKKVIGQVKKWIKNYKMEVSK